VRAARIFACLAVLLSSAAAAGQTQPDHQQFAEEMVRVCRDGGRIEMARSQDGSGAEVLRALGPQGELAGAFEVTRSDAEELVRRIDDALTQTAGDEVRRCLQPVRDQLLAVAAPSPPPPYRASSPARPEPVASAPAVPLAPNSGVTSGGAAPSAPVTAQPADTGLSDVDKALGQMVEGNVAFATPDHATLGKSQIIEAKLSVAKTPSALMAEITAAGTKQVAALRVSDRMSATLNGGDAFDVSPAGPQTQLISEVETTSWTWTVTPKLAGAQFLVLTFDALITVDGKEGARTVNTLRKEIDVEIGWPDTVGGWFDYAKSLVADASWLWGTILVPVAAFAVHRWRRKKRKRKPLMRARRS
jgi:hypothetical protein